MNFTRISTLVAKWSGHWVTFAVALGLILLWVATGPIFHWSEMWQLVINTGTTIITFLMVFLIQNTQNRDTAAIQAKLDEIIRTSQASNELIGIEKQSEEEIERRAPQ
jgi:low affinity Fe/Cu permease